VNRKSIYCFYPVLLDFQYLAYTTMLFSPIMKEMVVLCLFISDIHTTG